MENNIVIINEHVTTTTHQDRVVLWLDNGQTRLLGPGTAYCFSRVGNLVGGRSNGMAALWRGSEVITFPTAGTDGKILAIHSSGWGVGVKTVRQGRNTRLGACVFELRRDRRGREKPVVTDLTKVVPIPRGWIATAAWGLNQHGSMLVDLQRIRPLPDTVNTKTVAYVR